jgi:exodeoxyribonuclease V alpha subunit
MPDLNHSLLDMHFARFLASRSGLAGEEKKTFETVVRDLSAALAAGHSCLPVRRQAEEIMAGTALVSAGDLTPLVLTDGRLYLHRYFTYEVRLAAQIQELARLSFPVPGSGPLLDACFSPDANEEDLQKKAAEMAMSKALCIISGGPGTGKTSTVVRIIGLLLQAFGTDLQVALAAPTGKAAMRLRQSVGDSLDKLPFPEPVKTAIPIQAQTLHRLLGVYKDSPRFRHNRENPLPWDVVVVDEASMVDLAMMSKLVDALKPGYRLLLLGDKDQLASVESGAVLVDLVSALPENTVELQKAYRFDTSIKLLSQTVNRGDSEAAWQLLTDPALDQIGLLEKPLSDFVGDRYALYMALAVRDREMGYEQVFAGFNGFRVLCAIRHGHRGVEGINAAVEQYLTKKGYDCLSKIWYPGRPVLITRNDYSLDLSNGDIGICLADPADGVLKVWFERPDGTLRNCLPYRLPPCETAYALTVHKCQGSEFHEVLVVLPDEENRILSRELIYTAVTRAKKRVLMAADKEILRQALAGKIERFSGLKDRLSS